MADTIAWDDGSGDVIHLTTSLPETGSKIIAISSDPNRGAASRTKNITFRTLNGQPQRTVQISITQAGKPQYLWFEAIADGTFTLTIPSSVTTAMLESVSYSTDDGATWITTNNVNNSAVTITTPTIQAGKKVLWKGIGNAYASSYSGSNYSNFTSTADFNIGGDIASLFTGDTCYMPNITTSMALLYLFRANTHIINAGELNLSAKTISSRCCQMMFYNCSNLVTAPKIAFETVGSNACYAMFEGCKKLIVAPELNITTLGNNCLQRMFINCTSLTTPPPYLKADKVVASCYYAMFSGCSKLETAPEIWATTASGTQWMREMFYGCKLITDAPVLHITTLASNAYYRMFYGCNALRYIKMMATDISASNCLYQWVSNVAATGTFVKNSAATWTTTGVNGIPTGWTVQTASS